MRLLCLLALFAALLLMPVLAVAQAREPPSPTPTPIDVDAVIQTLDRGVDTLERGADVIADNAREFGQNFVVVILVLVIVVLSMALMLALIWYVFRPLAGNTNQSNREAADARRESAQTNRELMTYLKTSNDTQNRTNDALENNAKAFQDFNRRLDDGDKAGEAMAKAIKDGFADVNKRLDGINRELRDIRGRLPPQEAQKIDRVIDEVEQIKHDTSPLNPDVVPPTDPAANS